MVKALYGMIKAIFVLIPVNLGKPSNYFDKAIEINPLLAEAWFNKGNALSKLGHYEEAITCLDKVLEMNSTDHEAWRLKGDALDQLGRYENAIQCYDTAIEIDPSSAPEWINKGNTLNHLSRYEDALQYYDRAIEIDSQSINAWIGKGNSIDDLGQHEEAIRCYDRALQIDPLNAGALKNREIALERSKQLSYDSAALASYLSGQGAFVGSINSKVYHYPSCGYAKRILPKNQIWFSSSEDARAHGYVPCSVCSPL